MAGNVGSLEMVVAQWYCNNCPQLIARWCCSNGWEGGGERALPGGFLALWLFLLSFGEVCKMGIYKNGLERVWGEKRLKMGGKVVSLLEIEIQEKIENGESHSQKKRKDEFHKIRLLGCDFFIRKPDRKSVV